MTPRERCIETYKHGLVTRYVVTHVSDRVGLRTLTFAAQGQNTHATQAEAQASLDLFKPQMHKVLSHQEVSTMEVRACKCWPGHFDPAGIYFDC